MNPPATKTNCHEHINKYYIPLSLPQCEAVPDYSSDQSYCFISTQKKKIFDFLKWQKKRKSPNIETLWGCWWHLTALPLQDTFLKTLTNIKQLAMFRP